MRDQKPGVRGPGIDAIAALLPHAGDVILVENLKDHAEALLQLLLPLQQHRGRAGDDDVLDFLPEQEFAGNQPGLNRLSETDVIRDEKVNPRQAERLLKRLKLVGVDANARAKRGLE